MRLQIAFQIFYVFVCLAALGLRCCACAFSGLVSAAYSLAALVWASHCDGCSRCRAGPGAHRLRRRGTQASLPEACGVVTDQESNLCALRCQVGSSRLGHRLLPLLLSPSVVSDPVQPHRRRPARRPRPWDSPGKSTGLACHFLLQCMKDKSIYNVSESQFTSASLVGVTVGHLPEVCLSDWRLGDKSGPERGPLNHLKKHIYLKM